jgi:hypothetical protein
MARTPLGSIDSNRGRGFELSTTLRNRIYGARENGVGATKIARTYEIPRETVLYTLKQEP